MSLPIPLINLTPQSGSHGLQIGGCHYLRIGPIVIPLLFCYGSKRKYLSKVWLQNKIKKLQASFANLGIMKCREIIILKSTGIIN